jgi:peptidoglycan/LPS O-acetylase OafA/YrhL
MGLLRFLLATAVIAEHSQPIFGLTLTGGHLAVRLFFIISGFYMALILSTKYTAEQPNRYWLFITNRFLRIYPTYYVVFILSLLFYGAASLYLHRPADRLVLWQAAWEHGHGLNLVWLGLCQITVIGMDAVCLFVYDLGGGIHLPGVGTTAASVAWLPTAGADPSGMVPAWRFLFVPQSWSISIELVFYLMVPWLMSWRTRSLIGLGALSLGSYVAAGWIVYPALYGLLGYFFFPFHLVLFILGILAYRHSAEYLAWLPRGGKIAIVAAMFTALFAAQLVPKPFKSVPCVVLVFLSLPILFDWTRKSRFHKWVGDLSYPIYICHILVKWGLLALMGVSKVGVTTPPGWVLLVGATGMAALLLWLVDYPVDHWRQRRWQRSRAGGRPPGAVEPVVQPGPAELR